MPSPRSTGVVLFGEFLGPPEAKSFELPGSPGFKVATRPVKWLKRTSRYDLAPELARRLSSPNPVRQLGSDVAKYAYDVAYPQYKFRDSFVARLDTGTEKFELSDSFILNLFVFSVVELNSYLVNPSGVRSNALPSLEQIEALGGLIEQRISINSPGSIILSSRNMVPFLAAAMFALCAASAESSEKPKAVQVINSMQSDAVAEECNLAVKQELSRELDMIGYELWHRKCLEQHALQEKAKMTSGVTSRKGQ